MNLYSYQGSKPQPLPFRIRLSDGSTRTDPSTFTQEKIADTGYTTRSYTQYNYFNILWPDLKINTVNSK